ncbi:MAG: ATP-grasp domain-containing protein, partial [Anaerovoracaceae bacterium]
FVKPANAGSSVGISKVERKEDLPEALELAFKEDDKIVIEEAITGREIEVAVLGNENPRASCIGEIFAANEFYDYNAKYENKDSRTDIVRDLDTEKEREIRETAVRVYEIMGCSGLSRVDFFLKESGKVIFNEINTLPGFTNISMYPKLWEESGITYSHLIDELIDLAVGK